MGEKNTAKKTSKKATHAVSVVPQEKRQLVDPDVLDQAERLVAKLEGDQALPATIKTGAQLMMVMLAGNEAGMSAMQALNSFYIVNGRVTIWGQAVVTQLKRNGFKVIWGACNDQEANVTIVSPDGDEHSEGYTYQEAVNAGLTKKDTWLKYRKNMLRWKAVGNAVRFFCPEVLSGHYLKEEIEADPSLSEPDRITIITNEDQGGRMEMPPSTEAQFTEKPPVEVIDVVTAPQSDERDQDGESTVEDTEDVPEAQETATAAENAGDQVTENLNQRIDARFNRQLHAAWGELAKAKGWSAKQSDAQRKAQLKKSYDADSQLDLTVEQGLDMLKRIKTAIKAK